MISYTKAIQAIKPVKRVESSSEYRVPFEDLNNEFWELEISQDGNSCQLRHTPPSIMRRPEETELQEGYHRHTGSFLTLETTTFKQELRTRLTRYLSENHHQDALKKMLALPDSHSASLIKSCYEVMHEAECLLPAVEIAGDLGRDVYCPQKLSRFVSQAYAREVPVTWMIDNIKVKFVDDLVMNSPAAIMHDIILFFEEYFYALTQAGKHFILGHELGHYVARDSLASIAITVSRQSISSSQGLLKEFKHAVNQVKRKEESQADLYGYALAEALGHPPDAILEAASSTLIGTRCGAKPKAGGYHPSGKDRVAALKLYASGRRA